MIHLYSLSAYIFLLNTFSVHILKLTDTRKITNSKENDLNIFVLLWSIYITISVGFEEMESESDAEYAFVEVCTFVI
jgi:hypothetical protein